MYAPFQVHTGLIHQAERKNQTYIRIFLRKTQKFFRSYSQCKGEVREKNENRRATFQRKLARREKKRRSASGSARTPFPRRGILSLLGFSCPFPGNGDFAALFAVLHCLRRLVFELKCGVSLPAAARSAAALVYDKLTPNCQSEIIIAVLQMNMSSVLLKKLNIFSALVLFRIGLYVIMTMLLNSEI